MNEYKARLIAAHVFLAAIVILLFPNWPLIVVLASDFFLRAFNLCKYSLFARSSDILIRVWTIGSKPVDQAPKRFAAWIGLTLSVAMLLSYALSYPYLITGLAVTLLVFSFLESVFAFCAGCHVYTLIQRFSNRNISS